MEDIVDVPRAVTMKHKTLDKVFMDSKEDATFSLVTKIVLGNPVPQLIDPGSTSLAKKLKVARLKKSKSLKKTNSGDSEAISVSKQLILLADEMDGEPARKDEKKPKKKSKRKEEGLKKRPSRKSLIQREETESD